MKFLIALLLVGLCACAPDRVLVKRQSCQAQPGMQDTDNCELIRKM